MMHKRPRSSPPVEGLVATIAKSSLRSLDKPGRLSNNVLSVFQRAALLGPHFWLFDVSSGNAVALSSGYPNRPRPDVRIQ